MKTIEKEQNILDTDSLEFYEEVKRLKNKYMSIYQMDIADQRFIFKPLSRKEYKEIMNTTFDDTISNDDTILSRETMMAKSVIVYPDKKTVEDMLERFAGIAEVITEECMKISGFLSEKEREVTKL